jgi:ureidoacrylate peracid hydrolase
MREKLRPMSFAERIDPATTALVIVDVQNDFCHEEGLCGRTGDDVGVTRPMIRNIGKLLEAARTAEMLILFVRASYDVPVLSAALAEQYQRRGFPDSVCLEGTPGVDFFQGIEPAPRANEIVIRKHRYSAFWDSNIDLVLRANGIRTVVMTGISTDICVESTARDAFFRDYYVVVAGDACSNFSKPRHDATLAVLGRAFGDVTSAEEIAEVWRAAAKGERSWRPAAKLRRLPAGLPERLRSPGVALALLDLQSDFCAEDGVLARTGLGLRHIRETLPKIGELLALARQAHVPIIHVQSEFGRDTWNAGAPYLCKTRELGAGVSCVSAHIAMASSPDRQVAEFCLPGTPGAELLPEFTPAAGEHVVVKNRLSGFADTSLELFLRANGIRTLVLAGVTTTGAIDSTARDAAMQDYLPVVVEDCVADVDARSDLHGAALSLLKATYAPVLPLRDIAPLWAGQSKDAERRGKEARRGAAQVA